MNPTLAWSSVWRKPLPKPVTISERALIEEQQAILGLTEPQMQRLVAYRRAVRAGYFSESDGQARQSHD